MKRILITTITIFCLSTIISFAQEESKKTFRLFQKSESKKELARQRDSLMLLVDSLRYELEGGGVGIEFSDTLSEGDTINPGGLDILEGADMAIDLPADTDSLLSIWYHQKHLELIEDEETYIDTANFMSNIPDSVYIARLQKMNSFISLPYNNIIRNHIIYYTEKIPNKSEVILGLADYYLPQFEEIFDEYELPKELKAMAVIESALNPKAVSRARAKGMWQFMYTTALQYNLLINSYVDERFDPIESGRAAARYLRDSYLIFGDWTLAIASYNCGAGNVNKAIRRSGGSKDFWEIYPYLPRETRGYVPSFFAALYTLTYYKEHHLTPVRIEMPAHVDTLKINKMLHFDQISHFTGITTEELRNINPQYLHDIIPGVEREYILRLPYNYTAKFVDNEKELYKYNDSLYFNPGVLKKIKESGSTNSQRIVHKVTKGQTLSHIALRYNVRVADIKRWNGIRSNNIRVGQRIVIYKGGGPAATTTTTSKSKSTTSSKATTATPKVSTNGEFEYYTVKKGDTLWDISKMFTGVTVSDILDLNGLTKKSKIYPGTKLKIRKIN